ncbi:MAG: hypothetical protein ABMB14_13595 [Myxococcota bacterium]
MESVWLSRGVLVLGLASACADSDGQAVTLDLEDGGRIESWDGADGVEADLVDADGEVALHAVATDLAITVRDADGLVRDLLPAELAALDPESLADWLASYAVRPPDPQFVIFGSGVGTEALGTPITARDLYAFTCPVGTTKTVAAIQDLNWTLNTAAMVTMTFGKVGYPTATCWDTESTSTSECLSGGVYLANVAQGSGSFTMTVTKSAVGAEDYTMSVKCLNASGVKLGPADFRITSNQ